MSIQRQLEREEELLNDALEVGEMTSKQHTRELNELYRDYRAAAEESAQEAYEDEMECW